MASKKAKTVSIEDEARQLSAETVHEVWADADLLVFNARTCVESLTNAKELLSNTLIGFDPASITRFGAIISAFKRAAVAAAQADRAPDTELAQALLQAWPLRSQLLTTAQLASAKGLVPAPAVKAIAKGSGPIDCASDLRQLAELFEKNWETLGKRWGVDQADLQKARALGDFIGKRIRPSKTKRPTDAEAKKARLERNRYFTLMRNARKALFGAAALAYGEDELHEKYPALAANRALPAPAPKAPPAAEPAPKKKPAKAPPAEPAAVTVDEVEG